MKNWKDEELNQKINDLKNLNVKDLAENTHGCVKILDEEENSVSNEKIIQSIVDNVLWMMSIDRKIGPLKSLQGYIWRVGYSSGKLKGQVFADVPPALKKWKMQKKKIYIYSSGSVEAQKLLLGYSEKGDLTQFISGYFDTNIGLKTEKSSYEAIAKNIKEDPSKILFLSDNLKEIAAAKLADFQALVVFRPGNPDLEIIDKEDGKCVKYQIDESSESMELELVEDCTAVFKLNSFLSKPKKTKIFKKENAIVNPIVSNMVDIKMETEDKKIDFSILKEIKSSEIFTLDNSIEHFDDQFIPITYLIDILSNKSYQQLLNLCEVLQNLQHLDRKKQLLDYSIKERSQFSKLLVLIKWAKKASHDINRCQRFHALIDKTDFCFSKSSDILFEISRALKANRDPLYDISTAIDVLTTGKYQRLPLVIKRRLIPPRLLSKSEIDFTYKKIEDIIRRRLFCDEVIPIQLRRGIKIGNGCVTFTVENEFKVSLTLVSLDSNIPWIISDLKILVHLEKDIYENIPFGLQESQINYIIDIAQQKIDAKTCSSLTKPGTAESTSLNFYPLVELYKYLHLFCLNFQLEILHTQTIHLMRTRWAGHLEVSIDRSTSLLRVRYWVLNDKKTLPSNQKFKNYLEIGISEKNNDIELLNSEAEETKESAIIRSFSGAFGIDRWLSLKGFSLHYNKKNVVESKVLVMEEKDCKIDSSHLDTELLLYRITKIKAKEIIHHLHEILISCYISTKANAKLFLSKSTLLESSSELVFAGFTEHDIKITDVKNLFFASEEESPQPDQCLLIRYLPDRYLRCSVELRTGKLILTELDKPFEFEKQHFRFVEEKLNSDINSAAEAFLKLRTKTVLEKLEAMSVYLDFEPLNQIPVKDIRLITNPNCLDIIEDRGLSESTLFLRYKDFPKFYIVISVYGTRKDQYIKDHEELDEVELKDGCLYKIWLCQIVLSENLTNVEVVKSIVISTEEVGIEKDVGVGDYWTVIKLEYLSKIKEFGRLQAMSFSLVAQIFSLDFKYRNVVNRNFVSNRYDISEKFGRISIDNTKFDITMEKFFNLNNEIELKEENVLNLFKNKITQNKNELTSNKIFFDLIDLDMVSMECLNLPFGNLNIVLCKKGNEEISVISRVKLKKSFLPDICGEFIGGFHKLENNVITYEFSEYRGCFGLLIFEFLSVAMMCQIASQSIIRDIVFRRNKWMQNHGIRIKTFDITTLTLGLQNNKNTEDEIIICWKSCIKDLASVPKVAGKFEATFNFGDLTQTSENSNFQLMLVTVTNQIINTQKDLVLALDVILRLYRFENLYQLSREFIKSVDIKTISPLHHRLTIYNYGLDFIILQNGLISLVDATSSSFDGEQFSTEKEDLNFDTCPYLRNPDNSSSLINALSQVINGSAIASKVFVFPIQAGFIFNPNFIQYVLDCVKNLILIIEDLKWFQQLSQMYLLKNRLSVFNPPDSKTLSAQFTTSNLSCSVSISLTKKVVVNITPNSAILNNCDLTVADFSLISSCLTSKINLPSAVTTRDKLKFILDFNLLPPSVLRDFAQLFVTEQNADMEICIISPPHSQGHLPAQGTLGLILDIDNNRICTTVKFKGSDVKGFKYNYTTAVIGLWKNDNDAELISTLNLDENTLNEQRNRILPLEMQSTIDGKLFLISTKYKNSQPGYGTLFRTISALAGRRRAE
ncbi:Enolase-phosphatase E1 [Lobulomyces angularis]|nr:Enolase-phosphatase E1 [Lobulomyces angularis]